MSFLDRTKKNTVSVFANALEYAASGRKGRYATMGLNMAGVTTDKQGIQDVYDRHPEVLNEYWEFVDARKLVNQSGIESIAIGETIMKYGAILTTGAVVGIVGMKLIGRKRK